MDPIKEAFAKAKQDIDSLRQQITNLVSQISELKSLISQNSNKPTHLSQPTDTYIQQTNTELNEQKDNMLLYSPKDHYNQFSIRNNSGTDAGAHGHVNKMVCVPA